MRPTARRKVTGMLAAYLSLAVGGCGSLVGTSLPHWAGGLPASAPEASAVQAPYPHVYDVPPPRPTHLVTPEQQAQIEAELAALHRRVGEKGAAVQRDQSDGRR